MADTARTVIGKVSLVPRGAYSPEATYERLDLIQYEGRGYIVLAQTIRGVTPVDGDDYMLLVDKGVGEPGVSPEVSVERVDGGVIITIEDGSGTTTAQLMDGSPGPQGPSGVYVGSDEPPSGVRVRVDPSGKAMVPTPVAGDEGKVLTAQADGSYGLESVSGSDSAADMRLIFAETIAADESGVINFVRTTDENGDPFELSELILCANIKTIDNLVSTFTFCARGSVGEGDQISSYPILLTGISTELKSSSVYPARLRCHAKKVIGDLWEVEFFFVNAGIPYTSALKYALPLIWPANVYYTFETDKIRQIKAFGTFANDSLIEVYGR